MFPRLFVALVLTTLTASIPVAAEETFVGSFAEPRDGGNLDTALSTFDGTTVTIVPRSHASEAVSGATRWRNVLFAIRGVQGRAPNFRLALTSPGSGKMILSGDQISMQSIKMVWSYQPNAVKWNTFDQYTRSGTGSSTWKIEARNTAVFQEDVVYVSINEHFPVADFYEWLEADVFTSPLVHGTASEVSPGTFVIGYQSGAPASTAFSRAIPDMPLYGFVINDPAASPTKLVVLVSGQHPYEGQNKVALHAAVDWILHSSSAEAAAYRATYTTIVYPFVNPTGELAGLWRGTAYQPTKDTNRNWNTSETVPSRNRGIDTVIVHKNAMKKDIAAIGLGQPYAVFDYHQNFGDHPGAPDYVLHSTAVEGTTIPARAAALTDYPAFFTRLAAATGIADMPSDLTTQETLRGYMVAQGVKLPLTFERSVYNTIASELAFGAATVQSLVDPMLPPSTPPASGSDIVAPTSPTEVTQTVPVTVPPPTTEPADLPPPPSVTEPIVSPLPVDPTGPIVLLEDSFSGSGTLNGHTPDITFPAGSTWMVETGSLTLNSTGAVTTNNSARAVIDAKQADVEVLATLNLGASGTGLILRSIDRSNYLRFTLGSSGWAFQRTVAGVTTTIRSGKTALPLKTNYAVKAVLSGPSLVFSLDGIMVGTFTETFAQSATRFGLLCSNTGVRTWDSLVVRKAQ